MASDEETVAGLWAELTTYLAPPDILSANVVLAAQAAKTRMQGSASDGTACMQVIRIKSVSRRFTVRASTATGNFAKFGASWTVEQLTQHREFLAQEEVSAVVERLLLKLEKDARAEERRLEQQQQKERRAAEKAHPIASP